MTRKFLCISISHFLILHETNSFASSVKITWLSQFDPLENTAEMSLRVLYFELHTLFREPMLCLYNDNNP